MKDQQLIRNMAQHGHAFESTALRALTDPAILEDPEVVQALNQSLQILATLVRELGNRL